MHSTDILNKAREYIGTPYHHQARLKGVGIDCLGLIICTCRDCGVDIEDRVEWRNGTLSAGKARTIYMYMQTMFEELSVPQPGDVATFSLRPGTNRPFHFGWFAGKTIIHLNVDVGMVIEEPYAHRLVANFVSALRIPGID